MSPDLQAQKDKESQLPKHKANHLARLNALVFILMAASGFLRFYGAIKHGAVLQEFALSATHYRYLLIAGLVYGLLNLGGLVLILSRHAKRGIWAWVFGGLGIALYWFERFLLWAPEQRSGNVLFMILLHLAFLLLLFFFFLSERHRVRQTSL